MNLGDQGHVGLPWPPGLTPGPSDPANLTPALGFRTCCSLSLRGCCLAPLANPSGGSSHITSVYTVRLSFPTGPGRPTHLLTSVL